MVHLRVNEREPNPNKHINFISALPAPGVPAPFSEGDARQLLRALAAQVRPIMKSHGFAVNSFEEYEYNRVFAGRNWNNGETIELVLRRPDGTFASIPWLLGTLCHELAHIKHMNHGRDFQRLWSQLRLEVRALQERGYFGDGYWSSGTRISDSLRVGGHGIEDYDLPEYICGGAQRRSRPKSLSRHRRTQLRTGSGAGPSNYTGAQVPKRRKPGTRVKAKNTFKGEGRALNEYISDEEAKNRGTGFRKQAGSKRAREERALAAERRLKDLKGTRIRGSQSTPRNENGNVGDDGEESVTESDSEYDLHAFEFEPGPGPVETDESRRETMRSSARKSSTDNTNEEENEELIRSQQFMRDFLFSHSNSKSRSGHDRRKDGEIEEPKVDTNYLKVFEAIEVSDSETEDDVDNVDEIKIDKTGNGTCSIPSTSNPVVPLSRPATGSDGLCHLNSGSESRPTKRARKLSPPLGIGRIVQEEISVRKKEALGLSGPGSGRKLGSSAGVGAGVGRHMREREKSGFPSPSPAPPETESKEWSCQVCTLNNLPLHLACSACGTPRGENRCLYS